MLLNVLLVALGGAIGSVSRYLVGGWVTSVSRSVNFPVGTLTVNLVGCFVIGFLSQLAETRDVFTPEARAFLFVGLLGGFTTFSSFGNETVNLMRAGELTYALVNIGANVVFGLALVYVGRMLAYQVL